MLILLWVVSELYSPNCDTNLSHGSKQQQYPEQQQQQQPGPEGPLGECEGQALPHPVLQAILSICQVTINQEHSNFSSCLNF